jgi:hypothetical protein
MYGFEVETVIFGMARAERGSANPRMSEASARNEALAAELEGQGGRVVWGLLKRRDDGGYEEKRVDTLLALQAYRVAVRGQPVIVLSDDDDLTPAMEAILDDKGSVRVASTRALGYRKVPWIVLGDNALSAFIGVDAKDAGQRASGVARLLSQQHQLGACTPDAGVESSRFGPGRCMLLKTRRGAPVVVFGDVRPEPIHAAGVHFGRYKTEFPRLVGAATYTPSASSIVRVEAVTQLFRARGHTNAGQWFRVKVPLDRVLPGDLLRIISRPGQQSRAVGVIEAGSRVSSPSAVRLVEATERADRKPWLHGLLDDGTTTLLDPAHASVAPGQRVPAHFVGTVAVAGVDVPIVRAVGSIL